ncbi:MAG: hypothetical protein NT124_05185 [Candidatus Dependentiae bacterium]|nr:hypothetical protein [Candidatus Dependentiae bacterium]
MKKVLVTLLLSMVTVGQTILGMDISMPRANAKKKQSIQEEFNALTSLIQEGDQKLEAIKAMATQNPELLKNIDEKKCDALGWAVWVHNREVEKEGATITPNAKQIINYFLTVMDPLEKPLMVDDYNNTLLHYAVSYCDLETLQNICNFCSKASVCPTINSRNNDTYTPIEIASTPDKLDNQERKNILNQYMKNTCALATKKRATTGDNVPNNNQSSFNLRRALRCNPTATLEDVICTLEKQYYTHEQGARDFKHIKKYDEKLYELITHTIPAQVAAQMQTADQSLDVFQCATEIVTLLLAETGDSRPLRIINPVAYRALYGHYVPQDNQLVKRRKLKQQ